MTEHKEQGKKNIAHTTTRQKDRGYTIEDFVRQVDATT